MSIEQTIPNFNLVYQNYKQLLDDVDVKVIELPEGDIQDNLANFNNNLKQFDAKLRLGLAVREIILNDLYVAEKIGALKECHLMLYKLADIWFSFETYFRVHNLAYLTDLSRRKIIWLEDSTNNLFSNHGVVSFALQNSNNDFQAHFDTLERRKALKDYLVYCSEEAEGGQRNRLQILANNINTNNILQAYNHTDVLSMTYAIRNNFAHNGEITIYPENFGYELKNVYLKILYKYTVLVTISAASISVQERLSQIF